MEASAPAWELDSDEIASIASEDLYEHRPNRWKGPQSTWRTLTEEDRLLWQSMKQLQDQDLAFHLYNVFALKRRGQDAATAQDLMVITVSWMPAYNASSHNRHNAFLQEQHWADHCLIGKWRRGNLGTSQAMDGLASKTQASTQG